jgi:hypothetical protein
MKKDKEVYLVETLGSWIKKHGYDGLYADECGCLADDLCPCGDGPIECRLGYNYGGGTGFSFWVGPDKNRRTK